MITEKVELITPEEASYILQLKSPDFTNRNVLASHVAEIVHQMKSTNWNTEINPIIFDTEGMLIDGQHRLSAVVALGIPVSFLVKRGVSRESFKYLDQCKIRTAFDFGVIENKENPKECIPVFRWLINYAEKGVPTWVVKAENKKSEYEIMEYGYSTYPKVIDSIKFIKTVDNSICVPTRVAYYVHYVLAQVDKERADQYMRSVLDTAVISSCGTENTTSKTLNRYLNKARADHVGARTLNEHVIMVLILGWNRISAGSTELVKFSPIPKLVKGSYDVN